MAKLSADGTYVTVEKGDSLWAIANKYGNGLTYKQIGAFNGLTKSPYYIYVGQKIKLTGTATTTGGTTKTTNSNVASITSFGLQSDTDSTLFAVWKWSKSNTENYEIEWDYYTDNKIWFVGSHTTTDDKQCTYSIPANAKQVRFRVKPKSKVKSTKNNKTTYYFTASWSDYKKYNVSDLPPKVPSTPEVKIEDYLLTATIFDMDVNATNLDLQVVKDDLTLFKTATPSIKTLEGGELEDGESKYVKYTCYVDAGSEYKVRVRSVRDGLYSDWSAYSTNVATIPAAPASITTIKANSKTSVYLEWPEVTSAKTYEIEYTTKKNYFDGSNQTTTQSGIETNRYELGGLESGHEYFFRVRAINDKGESAWSEISSVVIGKKPAAPTTWSSTTTAITGTEITLYWVHNSEDGSSQTYADLELYIDGVKETHTIKNTEDEDEKDKTSFYKLSTASYVEGTKIEWRVRTSGVTKEYGDWSIQRLINVYAPPTLQLSVTDSKGGILSTLESFPFYIKGVAGPNTQAPIGYYLSVISNDTYETVDAVGNVQYINEGDEVYSKYFDTNEVLLVEMLPSVIDLQNGVSYTVTCTASMNSGLSGTSSSTFAVSWTDDIYEPNAEISIDNATYTAYIKPYCEEHHLTFYKVNYSSGVYTKTDEVVEMSYGVPVEEGEDLNDIYTSTGEQVFQGKTVAGIDIYYCTVEESSLVNDITLSVYRREFDGTFVEIGTGLVNSHNTVVTDPHPSLDYARYRIVAVSNTTGAVSYYDVPGVEVGETAIIIQWSEDWSEFDDTGDEVSVDPPWAGSLLRLPYNIDVSDKYNADVSLIEYIGRKHPVSYYGTQLGTTATWNVDIVKSDIETLYALRRLAIWMGDVYVREPSGTGYWANIKVSFSQKHRELTIPVTLEIARVEGGM